MRAPPRIPRSRFFNDTPLIRASRTFSPQAGRRLWRHRSSQRPRPRQRERVAEGRVRDARFTSAYAVLPLGMTLVRTKLLLLVSHNDVARAIVDRLDDRNHSALTVDDGHVDLHVAQIAQRVAL